jgi:L-ribulose-5-phosphate 3-epimerase
MKLGFSSYCFSDRLKPGSMDMRDALKWIALVGASHLEIATLSFSPPGQDVWWKLQDNRDLLDLITASAQQNGVELSGICVPANFILDSVEEARAQVERVKQYAELCDRLGIRFLRHDVTEWARRPVDTADFEDHYPQIVDASLEVAEHAAQYGVTTSIENHGFFMNGGERVRRLIHDVRQPNFKTTIDVGNFLCVDEDPLIATEQNLPLASFVHLKDFYIRPRGNLPGEGWLRTTGGNYLLGSILGFGDMDTRGILRAIRDSGYEGFVSIEFEGNEDRLFACQRGLENVRRLWSELAPIGSDALV